MYATDRTAAELEELQLTFGEGPCVDTFTIGGPVLVADLRAIGYEMRSTPPPGSSRTAP